MRTVLVIDDQRLDRAIATHAACRAGLTATGVGSIGDARQQFEQGERFDFVVLDLSLGQEDGLEALPLIAAHNKTAVVIFASGFDTRVLATSQRLASSLGLQVGGVLRKPIMPAALMDLLRPHASEVAVETHALRALPDADQVRHALASGAIRPWFQPKTSLRTGNIVGTEALARWMQPDGSCIGASDFIPLAEASGLARELTFAILNGALRGCAQWRHTRPDCFVAVNLTPLLLTDPGLPDWIDDCLKRHGIPPASLVLEVTESSGIPDTPRAMEILTRLRIRGISLSIDDFGTGHSSLLSLVRLPFNEMKIDQTFVREALNNADSRKVVRASASLGRELGLNVVAEGVETQRMADLVMEAGCDIAQGWLYGRAMPLETFAAMLTNGSVEAATA